MFGVLLVVLAQAANPYLDAARAAQVAFDYPRCLKSADLASRYETVPARKAEIELLWGLCSFELGRRAEALEHFELALLLDGSIQLPEVVSPKIVASFESAKRKLKLSKVSPPPEPAAAEAIAPKAPQALDVRTAPAPLPPASPSPALAIALTSAAAAFTLGAIITGQLAVDASANARQAQLGFDIGQANQQATAFALTSNTLTVTSAVVAVAALIAWLVTLR
ncbi:MAG: hypothetical protein Q8S33_18745 [Myxococcales bacterium]|nr:hypothetical protein [Myxococcales bacterium]